MSLTSWKVWFHDIEVMSVAVVPAGSYICNARFQAEAHKKQWDGAAKMIHRRRNLTFFEQVFRDISHWIYWFGYWELCLTLCLTFALEQRIWRRSSEGTIFRISNHDAQWKDNDSPKSGTVLWITQSGLHKLWGFLAKLNLDWGNCDWKSEISPTRELYQKSPTTMRLIIIFRGPKKVPWNAR